MARKRKKVNLKPVLFIACEGTSTEFDYFNSWAKTDQALEFFESIDVYPGENEVNPKTNPYQLFEKAKQALDDESADEAWAVFDKDNHPRLTETFTQSQLAGVKIAFSSRSFEEWVLMHFQKTKIAFDATECKDKSDKPLVCGSPTVPNCNPVDCLIGHIRRENFIPSYSKKKTFDLFSAINQRTEIAIVNAAWLRHQVNASLNATQTPPLHRLNPYTDVDQLILKMHDRLDKIEWGLCQTDITLNNFTINANKIDGHILVKISHTKKQSIAINDFFPMPNFFTTDDELNNTQCNFINKEIIVNNNGSMPNLLCKNDIMQFTLEANEQPYFLFNDSVSKTRIFVKL